jgi:hypothetical protein
LRGECADAASRWRIQVRAFYLFQMATWFARCSKILLRWSAVLLMVLDFLNTFQDENVSLGERKRLLRSTLPALRQRCQMAPILISIRKEVPEFMEMLAEAADDIWRVEAPPQPPIQMTLGIEF